MTEIDRKPFLPSKTEIKEIGGVLFVTIMHMAFHIACLLPLSLLWMVPAGDQFPQVASRLFVVSLFLIVFNWMLKRKAAIFLRLFGNVVSAKILIEFDPPVPPEPTNVKAAIERNLHLGLAAALMLTVVSGAVDFNNPWVGPEKSWGKYKWIAHWLEWFRTNSNSTKSLAWLLGVGSLALFGYRIRRGRNAI
jgi:hypothetical protein